MKKVRNSLKRLFKTRVSAQEYVLCSVISLYAVLFPIFGVTTFAVTLLAYRLKINLPLMVGLTWILEPLRFICFVPLAKAGAYLLGGCEHQFSVEALEHIWSDGVKGVVAFLTYQFIFAFVGWLCLATPICITLYYSSIILIKKIKIRF